VGSFLNEEHRIMSTPSSRIHFCPNCGGPIEEDRYVMRPDGSYRCEHCYFNDTYLEGVVHSIDTAYLVTLEALVSAIDAREHEVGNHSLRVTEFSLIIGKTAGVTGRNLVDLYCGALLHDIGKIGVPDDVLHKRGPLTSEEKVLMQRHPEIGYRIIGHIGYFARAAEIVRSHHEHFDGSGYPRGLSGDAIPHGARIFAVSDALDALTVRRPYREPLPFEGALETILQEAGSLYDPAVTGVLLSAANELKEYVGKIVLNSMDMV
jgi:putative nucleotidyltransferase with HDIG domain